MPKKDTLRKMGVVRSGAVSGTYKNAKDRPTELQMDDVYNAEKDLVGGDKIKKQSEPPENNNSSGKNNKTNPLAIIGFILAFFLPLIGFILSLIGLIQINKKKENGKGLAIAGIVVSCVIAVLHLILTIAIIAAIVSSDNLTLQEYKDASVGYTVKYPEGWTISPQAQDGAKGVIIKDEYKDTGKVYGQVEVGYIPRPEYGWSKDILDVIVEGMTKDTKDMVITYQNREIIDNGVTKMTIISTYRGENEKMKSKTTLYLKKDQSVFMVSTQTPMQNWEKYQDSFDEIHNTFQTN